ncbi:MAG: hypothetical protein JRE14_03405 [Deltaproteobacteria bacterium]|nr:hypothetical protein [Deltaproteobacteria bacterium]
MALTDEEMNILEIIARYNFLIECRDKGHITEEKRQQIVFGFGPKNLELVDFYINRLEDLILDIPDCLDSLERKT